MSGRIIRKRGDQVLNEEQSEEDFILDMSRDDGKVHIVGAPMVRPGSLIFAALLEYHWYPPGTPSNDLFEVHYRNWEAIMHQIVSFPHGRISDAKTVAVLLGLKISDGVPTLLSADPNDPVIIRAGDEVLRGKYFPGGLLPNGDSNTRMFTLQGNRHRKIVTNLRDEEIYDRERRLIEKFAEGVLVRARDAANFIFGLREFADPQRVQYVLEMTHEDVERRQRRR